MVMNLCLILFNLNYFLLYFQMDLLEINQGYEQKYHKSVKEAVKSNYSGDFAKLLTQIIDSHTTDPDKQTC